MFLFKSKNRKVGKCSSTYLPLRSCPPSCPLLGRGCYAQGSRDVCRVVNSVTRASEGMSLYKLAKAEADELYDGSGPLRLHVSGDITNSRHAILLAMAAESWDGPVWTYTHRLGVSRDCWGRISVLRSVGNGAEARIALLCGYAPAIVVPYLSAPVVSRDVRWIACKAQTEGLTCLECRLCLHADRLRLRGEGVMFEAHGGAPGREKAILTARETLGEQRTFGF